jgi:hypothetical protein
MVLQSNCTAKTVYFFISLTLIEALLEQLIVADLVKEFPSFMESKGLLPCLQKPMVEPRLEPRNPVYTSTFCFSKIHFIIILLSMSRSPM